MRTYIAIQKIIKKKKKVLINVELYFIARKFVYNLVFEHLIVIVTNRNNLSFHENCKLNLFQTNL